MIFVLFVKFYKKDRYIFAEDLYFFAVVWYNVQGVMLYHNNIDR